MFAGSSCLKNCSFRFYWFFRSTNAGVFKVGIGAPWGAVMAVHGCCWTDNIWKILCTRKKYIYIETTFYHPNPKLEVQSAFHSVLNKTLVSMLSWQHNLGRIIVSKQVHFICKAFFTEKTYNGKNGEKHKIQKQKTLYNAEKNEKTKLIKIVDSF